MPQEEEQKLPKDTALLSLEFGKVDLLQELVLIGLHCQLEITYAHEEQYESHECQELLEHWVLDLEVEQSLVASDELRVLNNWNVHSVYHKELEAVHWDHNQY